MRPTTRLLADVVTASLVIGLVVTGTGPTALAAPAPVTGLAASLGAHGLVLSWTPSGSARPVVRDVSGLTAPYDPAGSGRLVSALATAECPVDSCALDTGFANTSNQTYAVWAADADGSTSDPAVLTANGPLPPVATATQLSAPPTNVSYPQRLSLSGTVTRAGVPLSGATVRLLSGLGSAVPGAVLATGSTAADGRVVFGYTPTRTRTYRLVFDGDAYSSASSSSSRSVALAPDVPLAWAAASVPWKQLATLRGTVRPALPGTTVTVQRLVRGTWTAVAYRLVSSTSTWSYAAAPVVGRYAYRAVLPGGSGWATSVSASAVLTVTPRTLSTGLSGPDVLALQRRLGALHFDVGRLDGTFGTDLWHAVVAFQKVERLPRTGRWTGVERTRVVRPRGYVPRYRDGRLTAEVDVTRQVLVLTCNGVIVRIVDVSTGSEKVYYQEGVRQVAHTPRGVFSVFFKVPRLQKSPLGLLYKPSYFHRGFAIHGNGSVPVYPASHGCVRIPDRSADRLFPTLAVGIRVAVFDE